VQRADCFAARLFLMHLIAFTTELESGSAESLRVVIIMVVQLLFSRVSTVPRYIIILLSRLTTLPRTPTFLPFSCDRGRTCCAGQQPISSTLGTALQGIPMPVQPAVLG
jgi:hypothetical protein